MRDFFAAMLLAAILFGGCLLAWHFSTRPLGNPYTAWRAQQAAGDLPDRLGPVRPVYFDVSPDMFQSILAMGLARHFCGGVIFAIADAVAEQIEEEGLAFFLDARNPREGAAGLNDPQAFSYEPWRETPWPEEWFFEGALSGGFGCMDLDRETRSAITRHARQPASYYTRSLERELLVIPARRLVLLTMQD